MPLLNTTQKANLLTELGRPEYIGLSNTAKADAINLKPSVANPCIAPTRGRTFTWDDLLELLSPASKTSLNDTVSFQALQTACARGGGVEEAAALAKHYNQITAGELTLIRSRLAETIQDISIPTTIRTGFSRYEIVFGKTLLPQTVGPNAALVTADHVAEALA